MNYKIATIPHLVGSTITILIALVGFALTASNKAGILESQIIINKKLSEKNQNTLDESKQILFLVKQIANDVNDLKIIEKKQKENIADFFYLNPHLKKP